MAREYWRLNGYDLKGVNSTESEVVVKTAAVAGGVQKRKALGRFMLPHASESVHVGAKPLADRTLTFAIRRPGSGDHHDVLRTIIDYLEDNDVLVLQSPTWSGSERAYADEDTVWIIPESWDEPAPVGRGRLELRVNALVLGIPEAYGGSARHPYTGTVEKTAGGYSVNGGSDIAGPYLELPEQRSGWPKAVRLSDKALVAVSTTTTTREEQQPNMDGSGRRRWVTYDLAGFLHPNPTSTGDVGLYQLYSNPTQNWFEWSSPFLVTGSIYGGVASAHVGSFAVGAG